MSKTALPAVAKTIHLPCKKCEVERFFIVVAHTTATSAKVKCEVCGAQKTYKLPVEKKKKAPPKKTKMTVGGNLTKAGHAEEFEKLVSNSNADAASYNMKAKFAMSQKLSHPKFGLGIVRVALPEKIEVLFQDEIRMLVHNRG